MSYDYEFYCAAPFDTPNFMTVGSNVVQIDGPDTVEAEDIPEQCQAIVGNRRTLYRIHIQGALGAEPLTRLDQWLATLLVDHDGVLVDWQVETYLTATDSGTLVKPKAKRPPPKIGELDFIFEDSEWFYREGLEKMLKCIADTMPAAMPVRYGHYEPMQGRVDDGGIPALIAAFHEDPEMFMRAKTPFPWIFMSIPCAKEFESYHPEHFMRQQHLLSHVKFELRPKVFEQPKLTTEVVSFFETLCVLLDVTYARMRPTDDNSLTWRWYGLPKGKAYATCIGPRYQSVWPAFGENARTIGKHHLIQVSESVEDLLPLPPKELLQPSQPHPMEDLPPRIPPVFPFDDVYGLKVYR